MIFISLSKDLNNKEREPIMIINYVFEMFWHLAKMLCRLRHFSSSCVKSRRFRIFYIVLLLFTAVTADETMAQSKNTPNTLALDDPDTRPEAKIEDVAWMAGNWKGEAFGGLSEEVWSPPNGNAMMGMYKSVKGDNVVFYELIIIVEESNSLVLKLKHFNADLTGWEEKDEFLSFPLVKLTPTEAYFAGQTYRKLDDNRVQVFVAIRQGEKIIEVELLYSRVKD